MGTLNSKLQEKLASVMTVPEMIAVAAEEAARVRSVTRSLLGSGWVYTADEQRVVTYLNQLMGGEVGAGTDPIGFLIASHNALLEHKVTP